MQDDSLATGTVASIHTQGLVLYISRHMHANARIIVMYVPEVGLASFYSAPSR